MCNEANLIAHFNEQVIVLKLIIYLASFISATFPPTVPPYAKWY